MVGSGTLNRFKKYGWKEFFVSIDFVVPAIVVLLVVFFMSSIFSELGMENFVKSATGVAQSLVAVTLSGLAILISFSNEEFLFYFRNNGGYDELLFIFEYTVIASLSTSLYGVVLQSVEFKPWVFYVFLFLFLHLLASITSLVDTIIIFAKRKSDYEAISSIDEEDIPEELTQDLNDALKVENSRGDNSANSTIPEQESSDKIE